MSHTDIFVERLTILVRLYGGNVVTFFILLTVSVCAIYILIMLVLAVTYKAEQGFV